MCSGRGLSWSVSAGLGGGCDRTRDRRHRRTTKSLAIDHDYHRSTDRLDNCVFDSIPKVRLRVGGLWTASRDAAGRSLPRILIAFVFAFALQFAISRAAGFSPLAAWAALESVTQQATQHGGDGGAIAEQLFRGYYPLRFDQS